MTGAKLSKTRCSQCGGEFGPGNSGFSHCSTHRILAEVKGDPRGAAREIERLRSALFTIAADGDACTCHARSWYGSDHDTACPIAIARHVLGAARP